MGSEMHTKKMFCMRQEVFPSPNPDFDGIMSHNIIEGSLTSERFIELLRELIVCLVIVLLSASFAHCS
jgi:hypothetical protein